MCLWKGKKNTCFSSENKLTQIFTHVSPCLTLLLLCQPQNFQFSTHFIRFQNRRTEKQGTRAHVLHAARGMKIETKILVYDSSLSRNLFPQTQMTLEKFCGNILIQQFYHFATNVSDGKARCEEYNYLVFRR